MNKIWQPEEILKARVWPVRQAQRILERVKNRAIDEPIILEGGYGPSGLPHLGTATELIRPFMIAEVLQKLTDRQIIIIIFIDDMDGMRKLPPNLPEDYKKYLGWPVSRIPYPDENGLSFSEVNVKKFKELTEKLGYPIIDYKIGKNEKYSKKRISEIASSSMQAVLLRASDMYSSGSFDDALVNILHKNKDILDLILPTLGEERQSTYSPFMPISQETGRVLETAVRKYYPETGEIEIEEEGKISRISVNGKTCKLQWKIDFGMRWSVLGIDYEMAGKDIDIGTNPIAREVCKILRKEPPINWMYEMFLAEDGTKISKTKGNGISLDQMLTYMPTGAIRHFMFLSPEKSKRLDILKIPRYVDDFLSDLTKFHTTIANPSAQEGPQDLRLENPIFYSRNMDYPVPNVNASMGLTLIRGLNFPNPKALIDHLKINVKNFNNLDEEIIECMYRFYNDHYEPPNFQPMPEELQKYLKEFLPYISDNAEDMQYHLYRLGNEAVAGGFVTDLRTWFKTIYNAILGQDEGRRLGNFLAMCGPERAKKLIASVCGKNELK